MAAGYRPVQQVGQRTNESGKGNNFSCGMGLGPGLRFPYVLPF